MKKIRFGILSTANIGRKYVTPAIQIAEKCDVVAVASRSLKSAESYASDFSIPKAYGSYEELLADPEIDAVYIPLPNHLHVEWSIKSLEAGKHVLCEKPIGMDEQDALKLEKESKKYPHLKVMEAFMYRHHPRWKRVVELVRAGKLGEIKAVHSLFTYYNDQPENYRNSPEMGGGGLMDVGCYSISVARLIYGREPKSATGVSEFDPKFGIDRLTSGMLDFEAGTSVFTCSTQTHKDQYVNIYGTKGKIELNWPFNPDFSKPTELSANIDGLDIIEDFEPCNHFILQADAFADAILGGKPVHISLEDSIGNMKVIDALKSEPME